LGARPNSSTRRVRIHDVAQAAGVSVATVSRVLNGVATVAPELRERVSAAAAALGYRPNPHARALHSGRSHAVGVAATYIGGFFALLFDGMESELAPAGYRLVVAGGNGDRDSERETLHDLVNRHVDGLVVFLEAVGDADLCGIAKRGTPTLVLGRVVPGLEERCLSWDQQAGGALATRHLIDLGHERIAHLAGPDYNPHGRLRRAGYLQALREAGITPDPGLIREGDFREESGRDGLRALLGAGGGKPSFTAVFAANDQMALGALNALWERGLRCPEDVSLIGFDDQDAARYLTPPLTTVRQPLEELGRLAASRLLEDIRGERKGGRPRLPPLALVSRASVKRREVP